MINTQRIFLPTHGFLFPHRESGSLTLRYTVYISYTGFIKNYIEIGILARKKDNVQGRSLKT